MENAASGFTLIDGLQGFHFPIVLGLAYNLALELVDSLRICESSLYDLAHREIV